MQYQIIGRTYQIITDNNKSEIKKIEKLILYGLKLSLAKLFEMERLFPGPSSLDSVRFL